MIDFHCHFLPEMDDGADSPEMAYEMLCLSAAQGVKTVVATPHFYADEESPKEFLARRADSIGKLKAYSDRERRKGDSRELPLVYFGAEVYFFPSLGTCESLRNLAFGPSRFLLIEPPMFPWTEVIYDEMANAGVNLGVVPVVAHVDRFARMLDDDSLFVKLRSRGFKIQVNASFFTRKDSAPFAAELLTGGYLNMLGSDAHDLHYRRPNLCDAIAEISRRNLGFYLNRLTRMR